MALRRATRTFDDLAAFYAELPTLQAGAILLPPLEDELAPEIKLDLVLPLVGRVGPIAAQVVNRNPDGATAMRLPNAEAELGPGLKKLTAAVEAVRAYLLATGALVEPMEAAPSAAADAELEEARARIAALEAALAAAQEAASAVASAPAAAGEAVEPAAEAPKVVARKGRGFPVPDLSGQAPAASGKFGDRSFRDAIVRLAVEKATGLMTIRTPDGRVRYGFWDRGGPVGFRTDPVQEAEVLGVLLFKANQISKEQLGQSLELMKATGIRQGEALMQMGVMTFTQLVGVLGKQVEFILQKVLGEKEGTWAFHPLPGMPEQFLPPGLRVPSLLFAALVKKGAEMRSDQLAELHKPSMDSSVYIDERVKVVIAEIRMSAHEKKLVEIIESRAWRLREVFSVSPLSRQNTAAVILAMNELGFLQYRKEADAARALAALEADVRRKKLLTEKSSQFDILEVHWISEKHEVEEGYKKLVAAYTLDPKLAVADDVRSDAKVILERARAAHDQLVDDLRRREYRKKLIDPVMLQQSAELLSKRGEMAIMRKDRREAVHCFSKALELMPGFPEYKDGLKRSQDIQTGG